MEGHDLKDYLTFRRMITPILIQVLFWAIVGGVLVATVFGVSVLGGVGPYVENDVGAFIIGIVIALLVLLAVRVYAKYS